VDVPVRVGAVVQVPLETVHNYQLFRDAVRVSGGTLIDAYTAAGRLGQMKWTSRKVSASIAVRPLPEKLAQESPNSTRVRGFLPRVPDDDLDLAAVEAERLEALEKAA
jgi:alginate O-acetyltransferase complex protein AlgJ